MELAVSQMNCANTTAVAAAQLSTTEMAEAEVAIGGGGGEIIGDGEGGEGGEGSEGREVSVGGAGNRRDGAAAKPTAI